MYRDHTGEFIIVDIGCKMESLVDLDSSAL